MGAARADKLNMVAEAAYLASEELRILGTVGDARVDYEVVYLCRKLDDLAKWAEDQADEEMEARCPR